ncbi:MAG: hypothetical protein DLM64_09710 [Solirubrobacterales bacterium]|nr:MAG: hypothetical protein DLM64_09710 [Solirubrobacterales bacterium]
MVSHQPGNLPDVPELSVLLADPRTQEPLQWRGDGVYDRSGRRRAPIADGVAEFVSDPTQDHFGLQWNRFARTQFDSHTGTTVSRDRLTHQSGLRLADFAGRTVLEVGCGAGRFTEVLLGAGASVVSLDFSSAVHANRSAHALAEREGRALFARADVFELPVRRRAFDIVLCYGVLQHTGAPRRALRCLWEAVAPGGLLLVDRYRIGLRNTVPAKYALRPLTRRLGSERLLTAVRASVDTLLPHELSLLGHLQGGGVRGLARLAVNRAAPNSVYPVNLHLAGRLDYETARIWSTLDTFDMYGPRYDSPQRFRSFRRDLHALEDGDVVRCIICGQGNAGAVRRAHR